MSNPKNPPKANIEEAVAAEPSAPSAPPPAPTKESVVVPEYTLIKESFTYSPGPDECDPRFPEEAMVLLGGRLVYGQFYKAGGIYKTDEHLTKLHEKADERVAAAEKP